ncbi:hypothetical protein F4556_003839 [Kitasatospora gansuensis]|uniref:Small secreted protein n=1 Tax=Kitasatospora gansuensis TaxID=258050 RepID=A0A7W7SD71_9ACTN|nr:small secreted protein [Kitasatospora gansuensis]MBB4948304.1 hypothetical protein [Kitasatospora gansuensis]
MKLEKRLWAAPALGLLLAGLAVGCGGGSDTAALDSWSKKVCDSAQSPIAQSQTALADTAKVLPGEAPAELQQRLAADLGVLAATDQQLAEAISKAGAPKIDGGAAVQQGAVDELKKAGQGYLEVQQKLTALPNTEQAKFADGLRSVGDQIQRLAQQSTAALNKLQSGDLGTAIAKQPGCKPAPKTSPSASTDPSTPAATPAASPSGTPATTPAGTPAVPPASPTPGASG